LRNDEERLMAEIKSTLDIIMEKTRGLTMTEEEKAAMHDKKLAENSRGLVLKYLDGTISMERFKQEWSDLAEEQENARIILIRICMESMDPEADNGPLSAVLHQVAGADTGPVGKALERAKAGLEERRATARERIRRALAERGISGSAILPNLNADSEWKEISSHVRQELHALLLSLVPG
jgi:hypothetical protein